MEFEPLRKLQKRIFNHLLVNDVNGLSFNVKREKYNATFSLLEDEVDLINAKVTTKVRHNNTLCHGMLESNSSAFFSVLQKINKNFKIEANLATKQFTPTVFMKQPIFNDGRIALAGIIDSHPISAKIAVGISKFNSILTLCAFKSSTFEAKLNGSVTENNAQLTASALHQNGALCCVSADIAQLTANTLQVGIIKGTKTKGIFSIVDILQKSLTIGGTNQFKLGTLGFMAHANLHESPKIEIGMHLPRKADFTCYCCQDGGIKMMAKFSPRPWLDVKVRSATNALNSFNPVTFGYSLNINL